MSVTKARSRKREKKSLCVHLKLNCYQIDQSCSIIISALVVAAKLQKKLEGKKNYNSRHRKRKA